MHRLMLEHLKTAHTLPKSYSKIWAFKNLAMIERKTKSSLFSGWLPTKKHQETTLPSILPHDPGRCHHCTIATTDEFQQYQAIPSDGWPRLGGTALHSRISDAGPFSCKSWCQFWSHPGWWSLVFWGWKEQGIIVFNTTISQFVSSNRLTTWFFWWMKDASIVLTTKRSDNCILSSCLP